MWYVMNWKWYMACSIVTLLSGASLGWTMRELKQMYDEAKEAGAVA